MFITNCLLRIQICNTGAKQNASNQFTCFAGTEQSQHHSNKGKIKNQELTILIDDGSIHNFIQERVVRYLDLSFPRANQFEAVVENDEQLEYNNQCIGVSVTLEHTQFLIDSFTLLIGGADLVLGVQCLYLNSACKLLGNNSRCYFKG